MTTIDIQTDHETVALNATELAHTTSGWFRDPMSLHDKRYFDGNEWTNHVTHRGPTPCEGCA